MPQYPVYLVPLANAPSGSGYHVSFYTWGNGVALQKSSTAPSPLPDMVNNFAACVVLTSNTPPSGATAMGGSKDDSPPPGAFGPLTDVDSFKKELEYLVQDQRSM